MTSANKNLYLIAAGGTGGHIFPALAIAESLKVLDPRAEIHFVGTKSGLENKIIPARGLVLHHLSIGRLNHNVPLAERLMTVLKLPWAILQSFSLILKLKPRFVLGAGGHASGPLLLASSILGRNPSYFFEPNAYPGLANRLLSRFVDKGYIIFKESLKHMHLKNFFVEGYPLRKEMNAFANTKSKEKISSIQPRAEEFHLFIFGGSQGSRVLSRAVLDFCEKEPTLFEKMKVVLQVGTRDFAGVQERVDTWSTETKSRIEIKEFINNMEYYYQWADLAVGRSGMGTVSELAAAALPAILVPLSTAADNHQQKNAEQQVASKAALMILEKDFTGQSLARALKPFVENLNLLDPMKENAHKLHKKDAANLIAKNLLESSH